MKPLIAITAGDPCGIGPEVTAKALADNGIRRICTPVVIGCRRSLEKLNAPLTGITVFDTAVSENPYYLNHTGPLAESGLVSFKAVALGVKLTLNGRTRALVTAPTNKHAWQLASLPYTGHTEYLREHAPTKRATMSFVSGGLRCALVTEHYALKDAAAHICATSIEQTATQLSAALLLIGIKNPVLGICALNPHCGDGGKLGTEEITAIIPAIKHLRAKGIDARGPLPSDAAWLAHAKGTVDALVCMYHDQALAPLKIAAKEPIIHWTAGLGFIRTSPAHGTAFDIAGTGTADPSGMIAAIRFAVALAQSGTRKHSR